MSVAQATHSPVVCRGADVESIEETGLDAQIIEAARTAGYSRLTPLQSAALPVLRRGGNVVLHASSGAGVVAAFALPLLDRLLTTERSEAAGPRAVVLTPTPDRAEAVAAAMGRLSGASGLAVRAQSPGWNMTGADVLVTTVAEALRGVQTSALKLEAVQTLVLADLTEQFQLKLEDELATLVALVPREAQRVVTTAELDGEIERFVEAHARRALTVPARAADPAMSAPRETAGQIGYLVVAEAGKTAMLARLIDGVEGDALVYVRTAARAELVQGELGRRGVSATGNAAIRVVDFTASEQDAERVVSYDVPFTADDLLNFHRNGGTVLVTPSELAHFRRIAREAPFTTKLRRARAFESDELEMYREQVRSALEAEDLTAQLLVLDPLFEEHSPAEVAAALSALLRRRAPVRAAAPTGDTAGAPPKEASSSAFTRLFVSIGSRDAVRPADIVGAITGEAGIKGDQVGRVDIRETFSVVEVAAPVAEKVIRALNGTTMRGRSLRVDFDRKGSGGDSPGPRSGGPRGRSPGGAPRGGPRDAPGGGPPKRRPPPR
jgi:ATP-dependent RNA helicase DeaD